MPERMPFDELLAASASRDESPRFTRRMPPVALAAIVVGAVVALIVIALVIGAFGLPAAGGAGSSSAPIAATPTPTSPRSQAAPEGADPRGADAGSRPSATRAPIELDATRLPPITNLADANWVEATAARIGAPPRAVSSYAGAAIRLAAELPACGLGWNTLAAIGLVETEHGAIFGGRVDSNGEVRPEVYGPALDGTVSSVITDTDAGLLDGDTRWDRAVGPMQFIPTTWQLWKVDGNGDGRTDPHNLDDAAYTAARYLCADGRDLRVPAQWIAAVNSYNPTVDYNNRVAEAATRFAAAP